jgi:hypothetical protein
MEGGHSTFAIAATVLAAVALAAAVLVGVVGALVIRHDHSRIRSLQHQIAVLCARRVVTGVEAPGIERVKVQTAVGC